ncbi:MFS transporter [Streptomyces liliifuscus]|uniref:MFS transporter n=1 Tax=Streptomyces liliifuscus TaxID=2797636 RepID=A0A7T7HZR8_9ACTN|nr:MFS transporter [Streptomyces liliifuscus]QQM38401.1 MFS transporter [Streptomyces liliifuscus]
MTTSVPTGDTVPSSSEPGWKSYLADLWQAPPSAKAALAGCLLLMLVSPSGLSAMTTFIVPAFAMDTGAAKSAGILVFVSLPLLIGPIVLPFAGRWVDRLGARRVAIPSAVLYAALTALIPLCGSSVPALAVVLILASVFGFMSGLAVVFKVVSTWLPQHRGIGFALIGVASSLAATVFSPVFQWLISGSAGLGWKGTYLLVAAVIAVVAIPTTVFLISEPQEPQEPTQPTAPRVTGPEVDLPRLPGIPLRRAVRTRIWISITVSLAFAAAGPMTVRQNAVDFFNERGFTEATVSLSLSALFAASVVGLLGGGMILDRTDRPRVVVPMLAAVPVGLLIAFVNHGSTPLLFVAMVLLGFATGAESALGPFLIARYFGLASFAQLQGLTLAISTLSLGMSPFLVSAMQTATGSYTVPVLALTALTVVAVVLAAVLPKFPSQWKIGNPPDQTIEPA